MNKILVTVLLLMPAVASAAAFSKDSFIATDAAATSSFVGNFSVAGNVQFNVGDGILSMVNGLLSTASVGSPLIFSNNTLDCQFATSTQDGCLTAADWIRFDAATQGGGATPAGSNTEIQFNDNGALGANGKFVFDPTTGFLGVGTSTKFNSNYIWSFVSETSLPSGFVSASLVNTNFNSGGATPDAVFSLRGARGTQSSPSPVLQGDVLGSVTFSGFDGVTFPPLIANVTGFASENWTSTAHGAGIAFNATTIGAPTRTRKFTIESDGDLMVGVPFTAAQADPDTDRKIYADLQNITDLDGISLSLISGTGNGTGMGGNLTLRSGNGGSSGGNGGSILMHTGISSGGMNGVIHMSAGPSATTTISIGELGSSASHTCINMKDSVTGAVVSFYIANGAPVYENNPCQ